MKGFTMRKRASSLAIAIAMATGSAVVATAVIPAEANAQRAPGDRGDRKKNKKEKQPATQYSEQFLAAYTPLDEALKAEGANVAQLKPQIDALLPLVKSDDEKNATGILFYNAGIAASDKALQLQGMEYMIASGKAPEDRIGRFNFIAYVLSNDLKDYTKARNYLQAALDANYTDENISMASLQTAVAETYFAQDQYKQGYEYLTKVIAERKAQGLPKDEKMYRRALAVAYGEESIPEVYDFVNLWISDFPSEFAWRESVIVVRNLNLENFDRGETLDLLRLSRKVGALTLRDDVIAFVESAYADVTDAILAPREVKELIEASYASGLVSPDNIFIADSLASAKDSMRDEQADLPELEADANSETSNPKIVSAAGDAFFSAGDYAKAEGFYKKALTMAGVDTNEVLTRLGMSQIELGKAAEAKATLAKVQGDRMPIAILWSAYADSLNIAPATTAAATTG